MTYKCSICGEIHDDLPDMGIAKPDYWFTIPEEERAARTRLTEDICIIDDEDYFIRGVIEIPVYDYPQGFGFGVWISQKEENFYTYLSNSDSSEVGPFFGWLSSDLSCYEVSTLNLKTMAHFIGNNQRPRIEIELTDHPLAIDQHEGITLARVWEIVHFYIG